MSYGTKFSDNILDDPRYLFVGNNSKLMGINFIRDIFKRSYNLLSSSSSTILKKKSIINKMNNCKYLKLPGFCFLLFVEMYWPYKCVCGAGSVRCVEYFRHAIHSPRLWRLYIQNGNRQCLPSQESLPGSQTNICQALPRR